MSGLLPLNSEAVKNPLKAPLKTECKKSEAKDKANAPTRETSSASKAMEEHYYSIMLSESRKRQHALLERRAFELLGPPKNSIAKPVALNPSAMKSAQQMQSMALSSSSSSSSFANSVINTKS